MDGEQQMDDRNRTRLPCKDCGYRPTFDEIEEHGEVCPKCGGHGGDQSTTGKERFEVGFIDRVDAEHCLKMVRESEDESPLAQRVQESLERSVHGNRPKW